MSLIAQMLKDLDQREAQARQEQPLSFEPVPMVSPSSTGGLTQVVLIVAGVAVAAAAGVFIWNQLQKPAGLSTAPAPVIIAQEQRPAAEPKPEAPVPSQAPIKEPEKKEVPAEAAKPIPPQTVEPAKKAPEPKKTEKKTEPKPEPVAKPKPAVKELPVVTREEAPRVNPPTKPAPEPQVASFKVVNPRQNSENLYKQAVIQTQQGLTTEAVSMLRQSLESYSGNHAARKMLAGLLNEAGRGGEAVNVLKEGLRLDPNQIAFAMTLARIQVAQGSKANALATMEESLAVAGNDPEYRAFVAALQQDMGRFNEAVQNYLVALRSDPSRAPWLVGIGISLQAIGKNSDAAEAFQRALDTGDLKPDVARYAQQQLLKLR